MDSTEAPQIIEHINKSISYTPYDAKWVPFSGNDLFQIFLRITNLKIL
jgi:hypothetical protein